MDWTVLLQQIWLVVGATIGTALSVFLLLAVKRLAAKWGVNLSDAELEKVKECIRIGINTVEQRADTWAKYGDTKKTGNEKLDMALGIAKEFMATDLAKKFTESQLKALAESLLQQEGASVKPE